MEIEQTIDEWSNTLFSDESRFALHVPDGRQLVWRRPGERFTFATFFLG